MDCESAEVLMQGFLDGELPPPEAESLRAHLGACPRCPGELSRYEDLAALARAARLREPSDAEWDRFWAGLGSRFERRAGWVLLLGGVSTLAGYGALRLVTAPALPIAVRLGLLSALLGLFLLFTSVLRWRLRTQRFDRYRGVLR